MARRKKKKARVFVWVGNVTEPVRDKCNEELKVWHLLVSLALMALLLVSVLSAIRREAGAIRQEMYDAQAANADMIVQGFKIFGVDLDVKIKDLVVKPN